MDIVMGGFAAQADEIKCSIIGNKEPLDVL